jgi:tRNA(fMet)-specific endonuclease VapC
VPSRERFTSVITVSQLLLAARRQDDARLMQEVVRLVSSIRVAPYDLAAAQSFAKLRATEAGEAETDDVMMVAIAVSRDLTLVTRRADPFKRYSRLRVEDWLSG